jgi:hypothetical protein
MSSVRWRELAGSDSKEIVQLHLTQAKVALPHDVVESAPAGQAEFSWKRWFD